MTTMEKLEELIYTGFKETDRKIQETFEKTDLELRKVSENIDKVGRHVDEVGMRVDKVSTNVKDITDSLGRFAENMVAPAIVKLFNARGIPITEYYQRAWSERRKIEYDIVAVNSDYVVVVSVKMTLRVEHVKTFLDKRLPIFKEVFPLYKDKKVLGAVAGVSIVQESDVFAMKRGLFVLAQSSENMIVLNDNSFKPKVF
jgi:hypothetical protein